MSVYTHGIRYVTKKGKLIGYAWSEMKCSERERHAPHVFDSPNFNYGPYVCPGFPEKKVRHG